MYLRLVSMCLSAAWLANSLPSVDPSIAAQLTNGQIEQSVIPRQPNALDAYCNECLEKFVEYARCRRENPVLFLFNCSKPSYCELCQRKQKEEEERKEGKGRRRQKNYDSDSDSGSDSDSDSD